MVGLRLHCAVVQKRREKVDGWIGRARRCAVQCTPWVVSGGKGKDESDRFGQKFMASWPCLVSGRKVGVSHVVFRY
jgi:hypothetical protein